MRRVTWVQEKCSCALGIETLRHHLLNGSRSNRDELGKPTSWDLVTQVCCRDYKNKSTLRALWEGRSSGQHGIQWGFVEIWADYVHGVKEKLQAGMGSGLPGDTWSIRKHCIYKEQEMAGRMRKCKVKKRKREGKWKKESEPKWLGQRSEESASRCISERVDFMDSSVHVARDGDETTANTRDHSIPLVVFELIQALAWGCKAKWLSDLCRYGTCDLRAISTTWYSTELRAISQNRNKQQNQKVSLWTEPGALSGAHYVLSEKKAGERLW